MYPRSLNTHVISRISPIFASSSRLFVCKTHKYNKKDITPWIKTIANTFYNFCHVFTVKGFNYIQLLCANPGNKNFAKREIFANSIILSPLTRQENVCVE